MPNIDGPAATDGGSTGAPIHPELAGLPARPRVHALAKLLGHSSREVLAALAELGEPASSASSSIDREVAIRVADVLLGAAEPAAATPVAATAEPERAAAAEPEPVPAAPEPAGKAAFAPVFAAPAPMFLPPAEPEPARRASRKADKAEKADKAAAAPQDADEAEVVEDTQDTAAVETVEDTAPATDAETDPDTDGDEDAGSRRRRRRGRRGRGRGKGGQDDGAEDEDSDGDQPVDEQPADKAGKPEKSEKKQDKAEAAEESDDDADDEDSDSTGSGSRRRRRRRRRKGSDGDNATDDDPPNTVTHVRDSHDRPEKPPRAAQDEVRSVRGSTRLEAKRQRRRDGREAGRRRVPILSESEFLARREAVDRKMVVHEHADVVQIGVLEDGTLVEHFVTSSGSGSLVGNVYLGRVQNVLPSMEAAFVDIGRGRNAVLYAGEVDWDAAGLEGKARKIEQALSTGDSVLVQVTKDPVGHKGARLTTQISLPGRFLVYVPGGGATGISRKLPDTERKRLKDVLKRVVPEDAGVIIRTASEGVSEEELGRDVRRLRAQWDVIHEKAGQAGAKAPQLLYEEPDLLIKVVRDLFTEDFSALVVQGGNAWDTIEAYVRHVAPDLLDRLKRHVGNSDAFAEYRIDEQILKALDRKVWLPSGGYLVIDRTEAMTVIDVNTGKFTGSGGNLEETVTRNNLESAEEIVRQLRLRDIGGIIVIDFIDMVLESNRDLVLRRLTECLGRDRTRHQVAEVTSLGLVQMTRKRVGTGLLEAFSTPCEHCRGRGVQVSTTPVHAHNGGGNSGNGNSGNGGGHSAGSNGSGNASGGNAGAGQSSGSGRKRHRRGGGGDSPEPVETPAVPADSAAPADAPAVSTAESSSRPAESSSRPAESSSGAAQVEPAGSTGSLAGFSAGTAPADASAPQPAVDAVPLAGPGAADSAASAASSASSSASSGAARTTTDPTRSANGAANGSAGRRSASRPTGPAAADDRSNGSGSRSASRPAGAPAAGSGATGSGSANGSAAAESGVSSVTRSAAAEPAEVSGSGAASAGPVVRASAPAEPAPVEPVAVEPVVVEQPADAVTVTRRPARSRGVARRAQSAPAPAETVEPVAVHHSNGSLTVVEQPPVEVVSTSRRRSRRAASRPAGPPVNEAGEQAEQHSEQTPV